MGWKTQPLRCRDWLLYVQLGNLYPRGRLLVVGATLVVARLGQAQDLPLHFTGL